MEHEDDLVPEVEEYRESGAGDGEEESPEADQEAERRSALLEEYERIVQRSQETERDIILADADAVSEPLEVIHLDDEEDQDYFEIVRDFDAGTAVIYSAIINRVDY